MRTRVVHCKKEPFDIYIGRPSVYGNPFSHKQDTLARFLVETREESIERFEKWIRAQPGMIARIRRDLKGKILGCFCHPKRCHGDILAAIANEGEATGGEAEDRPNDRSCAAIFGKRKSEATGGEAEDRPNDRSCAAIFGKRKGDETP